ncbi:hypothetical protein LYNGBM3L_50060 [Moorena producens 3L]|uniref:Uncharacterized protein n=1 Tax=Moorena producens 3L TaxID=489825 RepID=F4XY47_9CYAN|nr:hypothetical protein LYNGBM3L_50060 [Moorena producens 3L]OLT68657.1 hypothetical protein BI334_29855 [Moorena producens 3L]
MAKWLDTQGFTFCLRLKESEKIELNNSGWISLKNCGLKPGISLFFENVKVTKNKQIAGFNIACKWKKSYRKSVTKEGWFIITNMSSTSEAIAAYKKRCSAVLGVSPETKPDYVEPLWLVGYAKKG